MSKHTIEIIKRSGEKAKYDSSKLKYSLERSGASQKVIREIMDKVEADLYDGITTKEIYKTAFSLLRKRARPTAARYKLKKAILELGPTGYPFEKFIAEIIRNEGFQIQTGVLIDGNCIRHEVDVIAEAKNIQRLVECKFHSDFGRRCDVKVPLYIHSRFRDIEKKLRQAKNYTDKTHEGWIYTNTRFTDDATRYGRCVGLQMVGWDYPLRGSLKERIDLAGLHPITSLTSVRKKEKQELLSRNWVLCKDIYAQPELLNTLGISSRRQKNILKEVEELCDHSYQD